MIEVTGGAGGAEELLDRLGLGEVVERRRGAVRVDVGDVGGGDPGVLERELHAASAPVAAGRGAVMW